MQKSIFNDCIDILIKDGKVFFNFKSLTCIGPTYYWRINSLFVAVYLVCFYTYCSTSCCYLTSWISLYDSYKLISCTYFHNPTFCSSFHLISYMTLFIPDTIFWNSNKTILCQTLSLFIILIGIFLFHAFNTSIF